MVEIGGKPLLEHQIELLKRYGVRDIVLLTSHLSEVIEKHFGDGQRWGVSVSYFVEPSPLGTTGGLKEIEERLDSDFLLLYGDVMVELDLSEFIAFHGRAGGTATLALHPNDHPLDSDLVEIDGAGKIVAFHPKPHDPGRYYHNLVNAALYMLNPRIIRYIAKGANRDFGRHLFPSIVEKEPMYGYVTAEYLKDVGTPERLAAVRADFESGKIHRLNRANKRRAIFLDRDGVINREVDLLYTLDQFELLPRVADAVRAINRSEYLAIVVTNQPAVARGLCGIERIEEIHRKMETLLGHDHAKLDAVFYCPHHPDKGYPGENSLYKIECACRKPQTGMLEEAARRFNIDLGNSVIIGDSWRDIECGKQAGIRAFGVKTGYGCTDGPCSPDRIFDDLFDAVNAVLAH
jgi:histidinol-phosphate phosphatase family protein